MPTVVFAVVTVLAVAATVAHMLRAGAGAPSPDGSAPALADREEMRRHMMWGSFYVNPDDPRGWVPKTWGVGWTVNFRTPRSVHVFVALLGTTVLAAVGLVASALGCG